MSAQLYLIQYGPGHDDVELYDAQGETLEAIQSARDEYIIKCWPNADRIKVWPLKRDAEEYRCVTEIRLVRK